MSMTASYVFEPSTVLRISTAESVTCQWCRRIAALCNGERTLQDIGAALYLPMPIMQKLTHKALAQGWLMPLDISVTDILPAKARWQHLERELSLLLGESSRPLLHSAAGMTRQFPGHLTQENVTNFLIALELLATGPQRDMIAGTLDQFRQDYTSAT